jgi:predicted ArsR family transcriptional regulator
MTGLQAKSSVEGPLIDPPTEVAAGARRADVLGRLREASGPLSAADLAAQTGLHVNTARFHLDRLVTDGLAERMPESRDEPGRPRILYQTRGQPPGPRSYRLLAEMLTGLVASLSDAGPAAMEAGRAWGRHLVERPAPSERVNADEAVARLSRVLEATGFQPETRKAGKHVFEIDLLHCPFREVAERHQDIVCAIHLGLMQGALTELRAPLKAESLKPFVTPTVCVARLRAPSPNAAPVAG